MGVPIILHGGALARDLTRDGLSGPDLTVWMRIAASHHLAAVFEDLHVADSGARHQMFELVGESVDNGPNPAGAHPGQREAVVRRETYHAANARFRFGKQQIMLGR